MFRSETTLMEVEVRVTDRRGQPVGDLTVDDFTLTEAGVPQKLAFAEFIHTPGQERTTEATTAPPEYEPRSYERLRRSTLIYIAVRVSRQDRPVVHDAIRRFIDENLKPGVLISIEGSPFTANREALLERLGGMEFDRLAEMAERAEAGASEFEALVADLNDEFSTLTSAATQSRAYYGYLTLYRYIDLIRALGIYPGRKMVVLFSSGFSAEEDNLDVLNSFADEAMRARVRFYVVDSRRLQASAPGGDATGPVDIAGLFGNPDSNAFRKQREARQDSQDGLWELAKLSGGRAITNTNDLGEIFEAVEQDLSGYYLLGYYPRQREQRGRFRRIRVSASRRGVKVNHLRGYYETERFSKLSKSQKALKLHQAVETETPYVDIPLTVGYEYFRGLDGSPVLAYSVGIHSSDLPAKRGKKGVTLDFSVVARARHPQSVGLPAYDDGRLHMKVGPAFYERFESDPHAVLHYTSQMRLRPGARVWRVLLRDENTGKLGSFLTELNVPDFTEPGVSSSLLLTGRVGEISKEGTGALDAGTRRFFPDSAHVFRQGEPIYLLYDIYNVGAGQLAAPPSAKLALFRGRQKVARLPIGGYEVLPTPERDQIRYMARLDTAGLETGEYVVLAMLPAGNREASPVLHRKFRLVADR
ncbi:MAG: VWA domain-containing protein [bacterium]|nr:VWA domain-containing protein [bacterium]